MPGIVGIVSQKPADECELLVRRMVASIKHERFDTSGIYAASDMGIYGGWVAHENSFAAAQVFFNERKDIALLFSGEGFMDPPSAWRQSPASNPRSSEAALRAPLLSASSKGSH